MRILLAHNSLYYPSYGGGDKSNRLLMEALAARGHQVRVVTRVEDFSAQAHADLVAELHRRGIDIDRQDGPAIAFHLNAVDVRILTRNAHLRSFFAAHIHAFSPDVILTSTDDPGQLLLDIALRAHSARIVYLVRATVAAPFGPDSSLPDPAKTAVLRRVDGAVGVSEYVARYTREHAGIDAVHVPISLLPPGGLPQLGAFSNPYVGFINPCAVKGLPIFLALARAFPRVPFAAVPSWGTTPADAEQLRAHRNVKVLGPYDNIDDFYRQTRVMLVPSLWAEARSRVILEAMSRGIPVMASDVGGLREAMLGADYLLPVQPVATYRRAVDQLMVPVADIPPQDTTPWQRVLERLLTDEAQWSATATRARRLALDYARTLDAGPLESYLEKLVRSPRRPGLLLTPDKRRLLALRLKSAKPT
jgi:glycosyltransferase involved in cell wall biosynthesis